MADTLFAEFVRVSPQLPCPVCARPDWCLVARDGRSAICQRTPSDVPWSGRRSFVGYLHELEERLDVPTAALSRHPSALTDDAIRDLLESWQASAADIVPLAESLGIPVWAICQLGVGWTGDRWSFPMRDPGGVLRGVRFRFRDGHKRSLRGGREGLFYAHPFRPERQIYVCEGPTDCAALIGQNFAAVGRPNCNGGIDDTIEFLRLRRCEECVIVADNDVPGRDGAAKLAAAIGNTIPVHIILPRNHKDARDCISAGGGRQSILGCVRHHNNDWWELL